MGLQENKELVREFMQLFSTSRMDDAFELLDDDMIWTMWGFGTSAGTHSKQGMRAKLDDAQQWFKGDIRWEPVSFLAEGDRVSSEAVSNAYTHGGYHHTNKYHNIFRVTDGKISEIHEMFQETPVQRLYEVIQKEREEGLPTS